MFQGKARIDRSQAKVACRARRCLNLGWREGLRWEVAMPFRLMGQFEALTSDDLELLQGAYDLAVADMGRSTTWRSIMPWRA